MEKVKCLTGAKKHETIVPIPHDSGETMTERENWDRAAKDYQAVFRLGLSDYNRALLASWQDSGMLFPGARVLDVGCGVGKYGAYLAEKRTDADGTVLDAVNTRVVWIYWKTKIEKM